MIDLLRQATRAMEILAEMVADEDDDEDDDE